MPSNPIDVYITNLVSIYGMSYEDAKAMAASLFSIDIDKPIHEQFIDYFSNLLQGNLGESYLSTGTPVIDMIGAFLPWTLFSVSLSLLTSFTLGIALGIISAYKRGSLIDNILTGLASVLRAVPNYLLGLLILVFLGVQWNIWPVQYMRGAYSSGITPGFNLPFIVDVFKHVLAPFLTYVLSTFGTWMLAMKASTISVLGEDYVTVAKAKGLEERRITFSYVGRNAMLPLFTTLAISLGFIFGGSTLIESVFIYRGVGLLLWRSINGRDYPVMQGVFLIITISVVVSNFLADLLYSLIDPRVRRR